MAVRSKIHNLLTLDTIVQAYGECHIIPTNKTMFAYRQANVLAILFFHEHQDYLYKIKGRNHNIPELPAIILKWGYVKYGYTFTCGLLDGFQGVSDTGVGRGIWRRYYWSGHKLGAEVREHYELPIPTFSLCRNRGRITG